MEIGGEREEQVEGFQDLAVVMAISIVLIYLALVFQFKHAIAGDRLCRDYGIVGALAALWLDGLAIRVHGVPRCGKPDWRHRQPHHRAVRLHRGTA